MSLFSHADKNEKIEEFLKIIQNTPDLQRSYQNVQKDSLNDLNSTGIKPVLKCSYIDERTVEQREEIFSPAPETIAQYFSCFAKDFWTIITSEPKDAWEQKIIEGGLLDRTVNPINGGSCGTLKNVEEIPEDLSKYRVWFKKFCNMFHSRVIDGIASICLAYVILKFEGMEINLVNLISVGAALGFFIGFIANTPIVWNVIESFIKMLKKLAKYYFPFEFGFLSLFYFSLVLFGIYNLIHFSSLTMWSPECIFSLYFRA